MKCTTLGTVGKIIGNALFFHVKLPPFLNEKIYF